MYVSGVFEVFIKWAVWCVMYVVFAVTGVGRLLLSVLSLGGTVYYRDQSLFCSLWLRGHYSVASVEEWQ